MNYRQLISMMAGGSPAPPVGGPDPNPKSTVFCCGFECGQLGTAGQHWGTATGASISTSTVRSGSRSLRFNLSAQTSTIQWLNGTVAVSNVSVYRFYIRFATLPSADTMLVWVGGSTTGIGLGFKQSTGTLHCASRETSIQFAGAGISVTTGQWYCIDLRLDGTTGAKVVDGYVDEVALTQRTTATGALTLTASMGSTAAVTGEWFIEDYAYSTTSGDFPLGPGHVHHFVATSDGSHNVAGANQFERGTTGTDIDNSTTTAYQLIDDVPLDDTTPDSDDYISAIAPANATDYVEAKFGPAPGILTPSLGPRAVEVVVASHQQSTGTGNSRFGLNDSGSIDDVANFTASGVTTIRYNRKHYTNPPSSASVWTTVSGNGNFNNLRMRFYSSDAAPDQYWDGAMIEAEFSE